MKCLIQTETSIHLEREFWISKKSKFSLKIVRMFQDILFFLRKWKNNQIEIG